MIVDSGFRLAARLLTGSTYAVLGFEAAREPGGRVGQATSTIALMRRVLPLPENDEVVVRVNGAAQSVAGVLLAVRVFPRLATLVLIGSMIPTTLAGHGFWRIEDPMARKMQRVQFQKNMAMIGGLLFALVAESPRHR